ncbi:MAG TPA: DNA recombination protein RmuC [Burkholderiales bacterium]|nr:DNA recombination protein RmuC [Burkholderiales bacterium]
MLEILTVVTLIAACAAAGMIGLVLVRERASTREAREEQGKLLSGFSQAISAQMASLATVQNAQIDSFALRLEQVRTTLHDNLARVQELQRLSAKETRDTLEQRLERLQQDNSAKLEQMRQTVDEKLHATLESRLSESFRQVSERLEQVHKGLGEMQSLAAGVGDLKKVLSGVKTRGVLGEVQLGALLEQVLTPEQYERNVATRPGSRERVEFAIKMPGQGREGEALWLPVDAKFPLEDFQRLQTAQDAADPAAVEAAANALEARVRLEARSIAEKYVEAPYTTEFAVLYVPFEGLYAEVLRRPGLFEQVQRELRVTICGPTTLSALLNSLQMGFRTLAIQKRSSEVWQVLGSVKAEFGKFGEVLANTKRQLQTVANSIELAETRTRQIERKLKDVEALPEGAAARIEDAGGNVVRLPKD